MMRQPWSHVGQNLAWFTKSVNSSTDPKALGVSKFTSDLCWSSGVEGHLRASGLDTARCQSEEKKLTCPQLQRILWNR